MGLEGHTMISHGEVEKLRSNRAADQQHAMEWPQESAGTSSSDQFQPPRAARPGGVCVMAVNETSVVQVRISGPVPAGLAELAKSKVQAVLRHVGEPVLSARVMLSRAADPAVERPAIAWAIISVNGRVIRASGASSTMRGAIAQLVARLRIRLERAWPDEREQERRSVAIRRLHQLG
jgi:hypothetical protein